MFVRPKRQFPKKKEEKHDQQGYRAPFHGRAASVPNLPASPVYGSRTAVAQSHQGRSSLYPEDPQATLASSPLPLPIRPNVQASDPCASNQTWGSWHEQRETSNPNLHEELIQSRSRTSRLPGLICSKFDSILSSIDGETFSGDERELGKFTTS